MAANRLAMPAGRTPNPLESPSSSTRQAASAADWNWKARFEAYNRLQAAAADLGEKLPIPEIVAVGGQSDGKSSLLEALLGFRFNLREVEMGTRRPLVLQMVHDPTAHDPRCRFKEEDSEEYGSPLVVATEIADVIKQRTQSHLQKIQAAVSSEPIFMRAEYAHCPNLTVIDTPGLVLKPMKGEPDTTPEEILSMVKSIASPPHRLLLFLQQSSVEWRSSLWLDTIREIDPSFRRTIIIVSKFDNRLKEKVKGGFSEEKYAPYIGFSCLRKHLESEIQKRYKEAVPATLALLEERCIGVSEDLSRLESKLQATSDVSQLRRSATLHVASICRHLHHLLVGAADLDPELWGLTTEEEQKHSGIVRWPGITIALEPANFSLKLYGGAAFERVIHEFHCAAYSMKCPPLSREKVANIPVARAEKGRCSGLTMVAADIARAAARSFLAPLIDTACDRLAFILQSLFELAMECSRNHDSRLDNQNAEDMDGYVGFLAAVRRSYYKFVEDLSKQCKQTVRHHLDSVTSPYYHFPGVTFLDLSDSGSVLELPGDSIGGKKKGNGNMIDGGAKKKHATMPAYANTNSNHHSNDIPGADDLVSKSGSSYSSICSIYAQYFAKMREVLIERSVPCELNSGFLTPWHERLFLALGFELFAVKDDKFMNMFVAPGAVDAIQNERESLLKHQKTFVSCLNEFKNISSTL
ncbi:dynamin-related protein 5A-like isoform X3 [Panicum virgatum]|uniref:dynamin-related protein 5A-like isoform X3 n=1 Tax=Panicum virgatum TaxID=38727 RepID=UPI0019D65926|nr:dynamin-related protein 5A-like isoform X3 [Panicum virgatum]